MAAALAFGAGGPEPSLVVLAPIVTFALPVVAMIGFSWNDWPGARLRPGWSGMTDTVLIVLAAIPLTLLGQLVVGHVDLHGVFDPTPGPGHVPTFPATMVLGGAAFVAMLQIVLVSDGWPLRRLGWLAQGAAALVLSWAVALLVYYLLVGVEPPGGSGVRAQSGPLAGAEVGGILVSIGVWQVLFFVVWQGWPFTALARPSLALACGNLAVLGAGVLTYVVLHGVAGLSPLTVSAVAGSVVAAGLLTGMLFEGWLRSRPLAVAWTLLVAAVLYLALRAYADGVDWTRGSAEDWVSYVGLDAIGVGVILHVAIGRRWPFVGRPGQRAA